MRELSGCGFVAECHRVMEDEATGDLVIVGAPLSIKEQFDLRLQRGECAIRISKSLVVRAVQALAKEISVE
jgi:hypothetical protein